LNFQEEVVRVREIVETQNVMKGRSINVSMYLKIGHFKRDCLEFGNNDDSVQFVDI